MLDIKYIREHAELVKENLKNRGVVLDLDNLLTLDRDRRAHIAQIEELRAKRNQGSKGKPSSEEITNMRQLGDDITRFEKELATIEVDYDALLLKVPNLTSPDTPIGPDGSGNKILRQVGKIPSFDFQPKEHWELGLALDVLDVERAAKVSGSRFGYLKGALAQMEFALVQFVLSIVTDEGTLNKIAKKAGVGVSVKTFVPIVPPVFIKPAVFQKMGRLEPKEERYYIPSDDLYLIGSAEHTLGSMHMDETFELAELPIRYIGFSTAFRREAGSYGKDMKGIIRVHQFDKLEFESFTVPEDSIREQDFLIALQEYFFQELGLPYQVVSICTGDMGSPDYRQIDIETWLPGQNQYRETHTADLMTDYQSRRLNIKFKKENIAELVHMNDATAIAIGRTLIAIMENYQQKDGSIKIPKTLQKYMGGIKEIKSKK